MHPHKQERMDGRSAWGEDIFKGTRYPAMFSRLVIQEPFGATFSQGQEQPSPLADWLDSHWRYEGGRHAVSAVSNDGREGRLGEGNLAVEAAKPGYKRGP